MAALKLVLVRHAESKGNIAGSLTGTDADVLSEEGERQAIALSDSLKSFGVFDAVYVSDTERTIQTARLAGFDAMSLTSLLKETNGGAWGGRPRSEFDAEFPDFFNPLDLERAYPRGESHCEMGKRVLTFISSEVAPKHNKKVLLFTHLGPINIILHKLFNIELSRFPLFNLRNCAIVDLDICLVDGCMLLKKASF
ncbi:phosphoglycerate mutase [Rhizobium sp. NBRC 114257]|uniref:Phosphoglycerate mutase n=1 Tax=Rhizobium dioscoreae TaxID=2653122 RepID=A0ABQ0ZAT9_9HYPH|nr:MULTISPECIES: histidine phosphatase family protein [Rhizobium]GES52427.1 phosphoglycerate mutase [Rhizobium dioscoreae]GLU83752.1 phosphoglycerate mutase [Rhizobium sp. NBRC 114257]